MGMDITIIWEIFCFDFNRDHYEKLIGIREFSELIYIDCFDGPFTTYTGTPEKYLPLLDDGDEGETVSTRRAIYFHSSSYPSTQGRTISDFPLKSASYSNSNLLQSNIGYQSTALKEGGGYTSTIIGEDSRCRRY